MRSITVCDEKHLIDRDFCTTFLPSAFADWHLSSRATRTNEVEPEMQDPIQLEISRRDLLISSAATIAVTGVRRGSGGAVSGNQTHHTSKLT